jgi:hypothetical protein
VKRALIVVALAVFAAPSSATEPPASGTVMAGHGGRFVFGKISDYRRDQFMLDTQSGRLWRMVCLEFAAPPNATDCVQYALSEIPYVDATGAAATSVPPPPRTKAALVAKP